MAPLRDFSRKKVLVLILVSVFLASIMCISASAEVQSQKNGVLGRRKMLGIADEEEEDEPVVKKKSSSALLSKTKSQIQLEEEEEEDQPVSKKKTSSSLLKTKNQIELEEEEDEPISKKKTSGSILSKTKNKTKLDKTTTASSSKNQTKLIKTPIGPSTKNQTKLLKSSIGSSTKNGTKLNKSPSASTKNKTKLVEPSSDSSFEDQPTIKTKLKKLNSTSKSTNSTKKSSDLTKTSSPKNKTAKATTSKESKTLLDKTLSTETKPKSNASSDKNPKTEETKSSEEKPKSEKSAKQTLPTWVDRDGDDDLVSEFRTLPSKFQETLLPDLERISKTSKVYLTKANKEITKGFKPYVGNKYAPTLASFMSLAFIIIPLILVSLIFNKFKAYFSLQKILIFIQVYLSIYFSILCLSSLVTGLEPLKFLYATSQSTYVCLQLLQTLAYALYLLLLLMYLILVFSTETGPATKLLGLGQTFVGYAVGLHYYMTVFHMTVMHQPPKTGWKTHAIYATCFLLICVLTGADRRKKSYLDGDEAKMS